MEKSVDGDIEKSVDGDVEKIIGSDISNILKIQNEQINQNYQLSSDNKETTQINQNYQLFSDNNETTQINTFGTHNDHLNDYNFTKNYSQKAIEWLNFLMQIKKIYISHAENDGEFQIPGTFYKADGFCKETNTIYEFYGCYWHECPVCYKSSGNKYQRLVIRENKIINLGYNLIFIWECTWNKIILLSERSCVKIVEV